MDSQEKMRKHLLVPFRGGFGRRSHGDGDSIAGSEA